MWISAYNPCKSQHFLMVYKQKNALNKIHIKALLYNFSKGAECMERFTFKY
jgi:hypothetical protein